MTFPNKEWMTEPSLAQKTTPGIGLWWCCGRHRRRRPGGGGRRGQPSYYCCRLFEP